MFYSNIIRLGDVEKQWAVKWSI